MTKKLRSRIVASSHLPKVGDNVVFTDTNNKEQEGRIISCYGRVYVIEDSDTRKRHAKIYDDQVGFGRLS